MPPTTEIQKPSIYKRLMADMIDLAERNGRYPNFIVLGVTEYRQWCEHKDKEDKMVAARPDYRETGEILLGAEILKSSKTSCVVYIK